MKKSIITTLFFIMLSSILVNANEVKEKTTEELIAEYMKMEERQKKARAELEAEKRETQSAIEVNKKLDELLGVLSKDK